MLERYTRPEMGAIWTDQNRYQAWLEVEILADELNKSPLDILQDREGSYILVEATKGGH